VVCLPCASLFLISFVLKCSSSSTALISVDLPTPLLPINEKPKVDNKKAQLCAFK